MVMLRGEQLGFVAGFGFGEGSRFFRICSEDGSWRDGDWRWRWGKAG